MNQSPHIADRVAFYLDDMKVRPDRDIWCISGQHKSTWVPHGQVLINTQYECHNLIPCWCSSKTSSQQQRSSTEGQATKSYIPINPAIYFQSRNAKHSKNHRFDSIEYEVRPNGCCGYTLAIEFILRQKACGMDLL